MVRKKENTLCLCVDSSQPNLKMIKDAFSIPRVEEDLNGLHESSYFSTLDLAQGSFQVKMNEQEHFELAP